MTWKVHIIGNLTDLRHLAQSLGDSDPRIREEEGAYILESSAFDNLESSNEVRQRALELLNSISGAARVILGSERPITVAHITEVRSDGSRNIILHVEPAVVRVRVGISSLIVTRADGTREERHPADPIRRWLEAAQTNPSAARVLRLRNSGSLDWSRLYPLFEIIRDAVGGEDKIAAKGWATAHDLERFRRTANSVTAAGDLARHGVEKQQPPPHPMELSVARPLIDHLIAKWLDEL